jgi:tetratricopeptide (TPR) repeat protein
MWMMFDDWDDFYEDYETLDLLKRYHSMVDGRDKVFFDLYEYECIIDYYSDRYNFKEAIIAVCNAIRQHPDDSSVKLKYVQLLIETCRPGKALSIIKSIGEAESDNCELFLAKGIALNMTGKYPEARSSFNKALKICDEFKDEVAYSIAQSYMQNGLYSVAEKYLLMAYHHNNDNILVLYDLGVNYEKLENPGASVQYYEKYLNLDPFAEHVWNNLGLIYTQLGDLDMARDSFDYALAINPQFLPGYFCKADMLVLNNHVDDAIDVYRELLKEDPSNTRALCEMGKCYIQLDDYDEALRIYKHTLTIADDCSDAWYGTGIIYFRQGRNNLSVTTLKRAINIDPENPEYWFMLGEVYYRTRKLNKAISAYSMVSQLNPQDTEAKMACAHILFRKKRIAEAISMLVYLYQIDPDNAVISYRLAAYYAYNNELVEAQRYLKKGLVLNFREHAEMFRHFPKTKSLFVFRLIIENHLRQHDSLIKSSN